ncbi:MAG: ATP12 family protein [Acetobacteraceae bacterium]
MRRFWNTARIEAGSDGFRVLLDGKPMRLPGGAPLLVDRPALAEALAAEWQQAGGEPGGEIGFDDLPLTRLTGTAQARIAADPACCIEALVRYGESDLLCYRAEGPPALVERQDHAWQPWLDWARTGLGAALRVTTGVVYVPQEREALAALRWALTGHDPLALAALGVAVPALSSLVLGLALARFELSAAEAMALATLDETFQQELWGSDAEALARRAAVAAEVASAARLLELARR